ncbi:MAG: hypothetical protein GF388_07350 [Candidatus Aegiribacteria sp.]|nr:hypothetical protein [Candidatus Aegiribacteria sp.]MBD3294946.1 hypothetical protein [Candidatus Fermentibacteria bacterium]
MKEFAKKWIDKFLTNLEETAGSDVLQEVLDFAGDPGDIKDAEDTVKWVNNITDIVSRILEDDELYHVFTSCSCHYPWKKLEEAKKAYIESGSISGAMEVLREQFVHSLREGMMMEEDLIEDILERGWGVAGKLVGDSIIVTKIPKTRNLREYMKDAGGAGSRKLYCHCPLILKAPELGVSISTVYCYCGGGFYRHIWETILDRKVKVETVETVCSGDQVCTFRILLGEDGD